MDSVRFEAADVAQWGWMEGAIDRFGGGPCGEKPREPLLGCVQGKGPAWRDVLPKGILEGGVVAGGDEKVVD